jgi:uncharacterized protein YijF (DUF1287 family)
VAALGSAFLLVACSKPPGPEAEPGPAAKPMGPSVKRPAIPEASAQLTPTTPVETSLGVADTGIWSDLDARVQLALPGGLEASRVTAQVDRDRALLVVSVDGVPTKPYPLAGDATLEVGDHRLALRPGDRAELVALLAPERITLAAADPAVDKDRDGLPDALDVFIGAKKTVLNADAYGAGYISLEYPNGDVPRDVGVCTDVIIRAMRNAGVDLQAAVHKDIPRARRAYPMIKGNGDTNIDHRRVRTILPWFTRHWDARTTALDDAADPLRPGDVVFMDTFPSKSGPDHIGIISDRRGDSGHPLVINNWTDGFHTSEMDLLGFVPITHRFRIR